MSSDGELENIENAKRAWEEQILQPSLSRAGYQDNPNKFYSPLDLRDFDFLKNIGFPGQYPFTAGKYPSSLAGGILSAFKYEVPGEVMRAARYSGYGAPEDTRDYHKSIGDKGFPLGPNIAFDLPTQCGYDSDSPMAKGEVGRVGVAVDSLRDFEVIYEAFTGGRDIDKVSSNFTMNAPCNIILAMYICLAEKRGISSDKLRGTPQNDILKEFASRGTYVFPIKPSMRMIRDTVVYGSEHMPLLNTISICGYHMREAGATNAQTLAFTFSNAIAYVQLGIDAGLDVDKFVRRYTFLTFGGGMELFKEVATIRAARRMWAKIMRERFGAKDPRNWIYRDIGAPIAAAATTAQRPINNLTRSVITGISSAITGGIPAAYPPYDEPLGLGWSDEASQLSEDAARILYHEAKLCEVADPLAGSYYVESLTDQIEEEAWGIIEEIDTMGGAPTALENGYIQREIAKSAYQFQRDVETGQRVIIGVNKFIGEKELEVATTRLVAHPYDPQKRARAEELQIKNLAEVKKNRDNEAVQASLKRLKDAAQDESTNLFPPLIECTGLYTTLGEMCDVLREVFGEYQGYGAV